MRLRGPHRRLRRGRILYSLAAVMVLLGIAPLLVASYRLIENSETELRAAEVELQLATTRSIRDQIRLYLQAMHQQVVAIAKTLGSGGDPRAVAERIASVFRRKELLNYVGEESRIVHLVLFDRQGRYDRAGPGQEFPPQLERYLEEALVAGLRGESYGSPPYVDSELLFDTLMVLSAPILVSTADDGTTHYVSGVTAAVVSLSPIQRLVEDKALEGGRVYAVDGGGQLIVHSDRKTLFTRGDFSQEVMVQAFQRARGQVSPSMTFIEKDGTALKEMVGTHTAVGDRNSPIPLLRDLDWGVVAQSELDKVNTKVRQMKGTSYWIAGFSAGFAVLLALGLAGRLSHPIARLAEGARRLAAGDFAHRIEATANNEIGELADTFNKMTGEIRKHIEGIERAARENKQMFMGSIAALAAAIDAKDPYTRGHSERVAHYAEKIAQAMGMSEAEVEKVRLGALMHDVGKIGIEDKILGKAGPLTDEEYEIMKTHPSKGAVIMEQVPQLKEMVPGMKYHHENIDGSGYPDGLKGEEIPVAARIVSVADTFDAMTTNRPYQKAMEITYVFERMRSFVGKKFDRRVVDALISAFEEGRIRLGPATRKFAAAAGSGARVTAGSGEAGRPAGA